MGRCGVFGLMTLPAAANCDAELSKLNDAVTAAETGATTAQSGVPATKHQEQVLTEPLELKRPKSSSGAAVEAVTPHQKEVMGAKGSADVAHPSDLMKEKVQNAVGGAKELCGTR